MEGAFTFNQWCDFRPTPFKFALSAGLNLYRQILFNEFLGGYNKLNKFISTETWRSLKTGCTILADNMGKCGMLMYGNRFYKTNPVYMGLFAK